MLVLSVPVEILFKCIKRLFSLTSLPSTDSSLLQDNVAFVLCLDTLGNGDSLYLHVSKPPKEGTPQYSLLKELETVRALTPDYVTLRLIRIRFKLLTKKNRLGCFSNPVTCRDKSV